MRNYTLKNYEDQLNHQVIHMDQAVCYSPEYRASGLMHDYPSRKLQLARSVWKEELEANDFISDLVFNDMLSRQGERWQNFGENPEDCTDAFMLVREMLLQKGCAQNIAEAVRDAFKANGGHFVSVQDQKACWEAAIPVQSGSDLFVLIDDMTAVYAENCAESLGEYLRKEGLFSNTVASPVNLGFEFFAHGLIDEGMDWFKKQILAIESSGAKKVLTVSAQAAWMLRTFAAKLDIVPAFETLYLPEMIQGLYTEAPAYVYAGSFNLRYLCNAETLNALLPNTDESVIPTSQEFIPLLNGDRRINRLTIWQKPIGAEYGVFGMDEAVLSKIEADALADIQKAAPESVVVFEPTALDILKEEFKDIPVKYYFELL